MSYAIIRNSNYKMKNLAGIYRHNERKNTNYSNKNIIKENSINNYSIKQPTTTYEKAFKQLKTQYNLKGQIKNVSNILCEFIITSDRDFFEHIGKKETARYFKTAYKFVSSYQNLGEQYIISAKVHLDESTPHLHIVFIPVIHTIDKNGNKINKISCSEFWKGKNSYKKLQDNFYSYMIQAGFKLERGETKENNHIDIEKLKTLTNYELLQYEKKSKKEEKFLQTDNITLLQKENKRIINKFNTLSNQYIKIKNNIYVMQKINHNLQKEKNFLKLENNKLKEKNQNLEKENKKLKDYINKTIEYVSLLFDFPINTLKRLLDNFNKDFIDNKRR